MQNPENRTKMAAARRDFSDDPAQQQGNDYADFMRENGRQVLEDAARSIDPVAMGMTRQQALTLLGAMKSCGFSREDFEAIMRKDPQDKGTFGKWWDRAKGAGQHGEATEGTIYKYAKESGWKWPAPGQRSPGRRTDQARRPAAPALQVSSADIKISCIMDPVQYKDKPGSVWEIRNREPVPTPPAAEYTLQDFARAVTSGQTFYPTVYSKEKRMKDGKPVLTESGRPAYDYKGISQQIFVVDIDNEEQYRDDQGKMHKRRIQDPLTIPAALEICKKRGIAPFLVYETFSSKHHRDDLLEPYQKFRLCFALDEPLTVQEYGERGLAAARNYFIKLFGAAADTKTTDNARLIYGTDEKDRATLRGNFLDHNKFAAVMYSDPDPLEDDAAQEADPEEILAEYMQRTGANRLKGFVDKLVKQDEVPYIPTGFPALDMKLDGGLYEGLYVMGAVSSLGKTTFALQMADQIAKEGHDVMIFSLEQSADELIAKSISRQTMILGLSRNMAEKAKTQRGISVYNFYKTYDADTLKLIEDAENNYAEISERSFIFDDFMGVNVREIRELVRQHIVFTGNVPVVLVDYLQVLEPYSNDYIRASDKQNADKNVKELKLISRDFHAPVFVISSFNRDNYNTPATLAAFKESGGIEYGADCILAMQAKGVGESDFDIDAAKQANPREIELKILKLRGGVATATLEYRYYAATNYFVEVGTDAARYQGSTAAGFSKSQGSPARNDHPTGTGKGGKVTKRDKAREKITEAFYAVQKADGTATIMAMADYLGISAARVKSQIKDLGLDLSIDGEKKTADAEVTDWVLGADDTPFGPGDDAEGPAAADNLE